MFRIQPVDRRQREAMENLGTKPKFWFSDGDRRMLFKAEERGTGEDWAEKVACHLCELLGVPRVHYELAEEYDGKTYYPTGSHMRELRTQIFGSDPGQPVAASS